MKKIIKCKEYKQKSVFAHKLCVINMNVGV